MSCLLKALGGAPAPKTEVKVEEAASSSDSPIRLSQYASGLGCAGKIKASMLRDVLSGVEPKLARPESLLVGADSADDAGVYKLNDTMALVSTTDFFPPIVDDPHLYGRIAAANAISDIYAMGGRPLTALNIVAFPTAKLDASVLRQILQGAEDKAAEAGCVICGGHSVDSTEPLFGLAVNGIVHPDHVLTNCGSVRDGDVIVITGKAFGTGVVTTACKKGFSCDPQEAFDGMQRLHDFALVEKLVEGKRKGLVRAVTDVTGFGLAGHLGEIMAGQIGLVASIDPAAIPVLSEASRLFCSHGLDVVPGAALSNAAYAGSICAASFKPSEIFHVFDPQTSGPLLAVVDASFAKELGLSVIGTIRKSEELSVDPNTSIVLGEGELSPFAYADSLRGLMKPSAPAHVASTAGRTLFVCNTGMGPGLMGKKLLLAHLATLAATAEQRKGSLKRITFMNEAARILLGLVDDRLVTVCKRLVAAGVDVTICGSCITHLGCTEDMVQVGRITTAQDNVNEMMDEAVTFVC